MSQFEVVRSTNSSSDHSRSLTPAAIAGNPNATRAHAWSSPVEGGDRRRFFAVLHMGAIKSPVDAVRAAIVAEARRKQ